MAFITLQVWTYSERIISDEAGSRLDCKCYARVILTLWES